MTMSIPASISAARAGPFAALLAQARHAPQAEALRSRRRGQWRAWSWQRLAAQAEWAARGWSALGVLPGDPIVALGPLGAGLIVNLFAADALGATLVIAHAEAEVQAVAAARYAFADGTHELERLLRHRSPLLRAVVVADAALVPASGPVDRVPLHSLTQLLGLGQAHEPLASHAVPGPTVQVVAEGGVVHKLGPLPSAGPELGPAARVFADFAPTWTTGLEFVLHSWPALAPLLLIPEPDGNAVADQRDARASIWLAPAQRLATMAAALSARLPPQGLGAHVARAALAGRRSTLAEFARWRIRAGMGLAATRHAVSDEDWPESTRHLLSVLGITAAPRLPSPAAPLTHNPTASPSPPGQSFDQTLVATP